VLNDIRQDDDDNHGMIAIKDTIYTVVTPETFLKMTPYFLLRQI